MRITKYGVELWLEKKITSEKYGLSFYDKVGDKPLTSYYFEHNEGETEEGSHQELKNSFNKCFEELCEKYAGKVVGDYKFVVERKYDIVETNAKAKNFLEEE